MAACSSTAGASSPSLVTGAAASICALPASASTCPERKVRAVVRDVPGPVVERVLRSAAAIPSEQVVDRSSVQGWVSVFTIAAAMNFEILFQVMGLSRVNDLDAHRAVVIVRALRVFRPVLILREDPLVLPCLASRLRAVRLQNTSV